VFPFYYVVRDDLPAMHDFQGDDEEERLRQIRHTGHEWYKDNMRVAQYRDDLPATHDFQGDVEEECLHRVRQTGNEWNKDNKHTVWSSRPMATSG
jgi:hypothetical protein